MKNIHYAWWLVKKYNILGNWNVNLNVGEMLNTESTNLMEEEEEIMIEIWYYFHHTAFILMNYGQIKEHFKRSREITCTTTGT